MLTWFYDNTAWVLFGLISTLGVILIYATPWKIFVLVFNGIFTIGIKLVERNFSRQLMYSRTLPAENRPKTLDAYRDGSANRRERSETYLRFFEQKTCDMNGPYAVQLYVEGLRDRNLDDAHRNLRADLKEYDRREEELRKEIYAMDAELQTLRDAEQGRLTRAETSLMDFHTLWMQKHAAAKETGTFAGMIAMLRDKDLRRARRKWKISSRIVARNSKALKKKIEKIEARYLPRILPRLAMPHDFEMANLHKRVHLFEADWASFRQTVITGRTLELLCSEQTETMKALRTKLNLDDIPTDIDAWKVQMFEDLKGKIALHPRISTPELGEIWLRQRFLKLGADGCPAEERIGSDGFYLWVSQLAEPATLDA